jgi:hypothetical protein
MYFFCITWGFQDGEYSWCALLGYEKKRDGRWLPVFWRNILPPSSGFHLTFKYRGRHIVKKIHIVTIKDWHICNETEIPDRWQNLQDTSEKKTFVIFPVRKLKLHTNKYLIFRNHIPLIFSQNCETDLLMPNCIYIGTTVFTINRLHPLHVSINVGVYRMVRPCIPFSQHHGQGLITPVACAPVVTENTARNNEYYNQTWRSPRGAPSHWLFS